MQDGLTYPAAGEVSERSEKLGGGLLLTLDGAVDPPAGAPPERSGWWCTLSLSWTLGREGAAALNEGDLALQEVATTGELSAILAGGEAETDPDTGQTTVHATFTVDDGPLAGRCIVADLAVGGEEWRGVLRLVE